MMSKLAIKRWQSSSYLLIGVVLSAALVAFMLWVFVIQQNVTEVSVTQSDRVNNVKEDRTVICYFVEPDFQLRWMHSVEKQWWEEQYSRQDNQLLLTNTYFQAFGAGTPSTETLAVVQKPGYIGYQINEYYPHLNWVVSRLTQGEIDYADHRLPVHQWLPDYSEVTIAPKAYTLMDKLNKEFCHELASDGAQ